MEKMNIKYMGKTIQGEGKKKDGSDWKKYKISTKANFGQGDKDQNFTAWSSLLESKDNKATVNLIEGNYYTFKYELKEFKGKDGNMAKSKELKEIIPFTNNMNSSETAQKKLTGLDLNINQINIPDNNKLNLMIDKYFEKIKQGKLDGLSINDMLHNHFVGTIILSENKNNPELDRLKKLFTDKEVDSQIM